MQIVVCINPASTDAAASSASNLSNQPSQQPPGELPAPTQPPTPSPAVSLVDNRTIAVASSASLFTFDAVYDSAPASLYAESVWPLVRRFVDGSHVDVLCYGRTSISNKTATNYSVSADCVHRALADLFDSIHEYTIAHADLTPLFNVSVSLVEQLNEDLTDLISNNNVLVGNDQDIGFVGAEYPVVHDATDAIKCVDFAKTLQHLETQPEPTILSSRLRFIHLADTKENIVSAVTTVNSGLLALRTLVSRAASADSVDYRLSKLTWALRDCFEGKSVETLKSDLGLRYRIPESSESLLISCVSPLEVDIKDTMRILKFSNRASKLNRLSVVNTENAQETELVSLRALVNRLKSENAILKSGVVEHDVILSEMEALRMDLEARDEDVLKLKAQCNFLNNELSVLKTETVRRVYSNATYAPGNHQHSQLHDFSDTESIASTATSISIAESESRLPRSKTPTNSGPVSHPSTKQSPRMQRSRSRAPSSTATSNFLTPAASPLPRIAADRRTSVSNTPPLPPATAPPSISRSSSQPVVSSTNLHPASTDANGSSLVDVQSRTIKRLGHELRAMTCVAQEFLTRVEELDGQVGFLRKEVFALEDTVARKGPTPAVTSGDGAALAQDSKEGLQDEIDYMKANERASLHKIEILTAKLEKVEKAYEGAEEYINGLEAELGRQEEVLLQIQELESQLQKAGEGESSSAQKIKSLEESVKECSSHIETITSLQNQMKAMKATYESASHSEAIDTVKLEQPRGIESAETDALVNALSRAETAEQKLAFIFADSDADIDFGVLDVASSADESRANGKEHGVVSDLMDRFGWASNTTLEDAKKKLSKAEAFNRRMRDDVEVLKARIKVLSKPNAARRSRSVSFRLPNEDASTQSEAQILPLAEHVRLLEEERLKGQEAHESLVAAANFLSISKASISSLKLELEDQKSLVELKTQDYETTREKLEKLKAASASALRRHCADVMDLKQAQEAVEKELRYLDGAEDLDLTPLKDVKKANVATQSEEEIMLMHDHPELLRDEQYLWEQEYNRKKETTTREASQGTSTFGVAEAGTQSNSDRMPVSEHERILHAEREKIGSALSQSSNSTITTLEEQILRHRISSETNTREHNEQVQSLRVQLELLMTSSSAALERHCLEIQGLRESRPLVPVSKVTQDQSIEAVASRIDSTTQSESDVILLSEHEVILARERTERSLPSGLEASTQYDADLLNESQNLFAKERALPIAKPETKDAESHTDTEMTIDFRPKATPALMLNSSVQSEDDVMLLLEHQRILTEERSQSQKLRINMAAISSDLVECKANVSNLQEMLRTKNLELESAVHLQQVGTERIQSMQLQLEALVSASVSSLKQHCNEASDIEKARIDLEREVTEMKARCEDAVNRADILQSNFDKEKARRRNSGELTEELRNLWIKLDAEEDLGRKKSLEISRLEERVEEVLLDLAQSRETNARVPELEVLLRESNTKLSDSQTRIGILQSELDQVQATLHSMRTGSTRDGFSAPVASISDMDAMHMSEMISDRQRTVKDRVVSLQTELNNQEPLLGRRKSTLVHSTHDAEVQSDMDALQFASILKVHQSAVADLKAAKSESDQLESRNIELEKMVEDLEIQVLAQQDAARAHQKSFTLSNASLSRGLGLDDDEKLLLKAEVADLKARLKGLQELRSEVFNVASKHYTEDDMKKAMSRIDSLLLQIETMSAAYTAKVDVLNKELDVARSSYEAAASELQNAKSEIIVLKNEVALARREIVTMKEEFATLDAAKVAVEKLHQAALLVTSDLERRLDAVNMHFEVLAQKLSDLGAAEAASLKSEISELEIRRAEISHALKQSEDIQRTDRIAFEASSMALTEELSAVNESLRNVKANLSTASVDRDDAKIKLAAALAKISEKDSDLSIMIADRDATNTKLAVALENLSGKEAMLAAEVVAHQTTSQTLVKEISEKVEMIKALEQKMVDLKKEHHDVVESKSRSIEMHKVSSTEAIKASEDLMQVECSKLEEAKSKLEMKLATINVTLSLITKQYQESLEECENLRNELAQANEEIDALDRELEEETAIADAESLKVQDIELRLQEEQRQHEALTTALLRMHEEVFSLGKGANDRYADLQQRFDQVQLQHEILLAEMESDHRKTQTLYRNSSNRVAELERKLQEEMMRQDVITKDMKAKDEELSAIQSSANARVQELERLLQEEVTKRDIVSRDVRAKDEELSSVQSATSAQVQELEQQLQEEVMKRDAVARDARAKNEEFSAVLSATRTRVQELERQLQEEMINRDAATQDMKAKDEEMLSVQSAANNRVQELERQLQDEVMKRDAVTRDMKAKDEELSAIQRATRTRMQELERLLQEEVAKRDAAARDVRGKDEALSSIQSAANTRVQELENMIQISEKQIAEMEGNLRSATSKANFLETQIFEFQDKADKEITSLQTKHRLECESHQATAAKLGELEARHRDLKEAHESELVSFSNVRSISRDVHLSAESKIKELELQSAETRDLHTAASANVVKLETQLAEMKKAHTIQLFDIKNELDTKCALLEAAVQRAEDAGSLLIKTRVELESIIANLRQECALEKSRQVASEKEVQKLLAESTDLASRLQQVHLQNETLSLKLVRAQQEMMESTSDLHATIGELSKKADERVSMESQQKSREIFTSSVRVQELESLLAASQAALQNIETRLVNLSTSYQVEKSNLEIELQNARNTNISNASRLAELEMQNRQMHELQSTAHQNQNELDAKHRIVLDELEVCKKALSESETSAASLKARLTETEKQHEILSEKFSRDVSHSQILQSVMADKARELEDRLALSLKQYEALIGKFQQDHESTVSGFAGRISETERTRSVLVLENASLEVKKEELLTLNQYNERIISDLRRELKTSQDQLYTAAEMEKKQSEQLRKLQSDINDLKLQHDTAINQMTSDYQRSRSLHTASSNQVQRLESTVEDLKGESDTAFMLLQSDHQSLISDHSILKQQARSLEQRLEAMQKHYETLLSKFDSDYELSQSISSSRVVKELETRLEHIQKHHDTVIAGMEKDHEEIMNQLIGRASESERTRATMAFSLSSLEKQCSEMSQHRLNSLEQISRHETEILSLRTVLDGKDKAMQLAEAQSQKRIQELEIRLESVLTQYDVSMKNLQHEHQATCSLLAETQNRLQQAEQLASSRSVSYASLPSQPIALPSTSRDIQSSSVDSFRSISNGQNSTAEMHSIRDVESISNEEANNLRLRLANVEQRHETFASILSDKLQTHASDTTETMESLKAALKEKYLALMDAVNNNNDLASRISKRESTISALESQLSQCQITISELKTRLQNNESDEAALRNLWIKLDKEEDLGRKKSLEITRLEERLEEVLGQLSGSRDSVARVPELENQLKSIAEAHKSTIELHTRSTDELSNWKARYDDECHRNRELEAALISHNQQNELLVERLQEKISQLSANANAQNDEQLNGLSSEIDALRSQIAVLLEENGHLKAQIESQGELHSRELSRIQSQWELQSRELSGQINSFKLDLDTTSGQLDAAVDQHLKATVMHGIEVGDYQSVISALKAELADAKDARKGLQPDSQMIQDQHESRLNEMRSVPKGSAPASSEVVSTTTVTTRSVDTFEPESTKMQQDPSIFSAFTDEHWYMLSQELLRKDHRIKELEEKLEMVASIPGVLEKWEKTFEEQETDLEILEQELSNVQLELVRMKEHYEKEITRMIEVHRREVMTVKETHVREVQREIPGGNDEASTLFDLQSHPGFEIIAVQFAQKNQKISELEGKLASLAAIPDVLKDWEEAFTAQETDIDELENELEAAHREIIRLQMAQAKAMDAEASRSLADASREEARSRQPSAQSFASNTATLIQSPATVVYQGSVIPHFTSETFDIAFDEETGEYFLPEMTPDASRSTITQTVESKDYITILRTQVTRLERALSDSRSKILKLQSQISNLELANQDASLRVSRARADLLDANTAKSLLQARLDRIRRRTICGMVKASLKSG
ncbi:hypothetical protein HDU80_004824 [Chytriomyces hyalinus]|nr:hypothetical protein HDU80_004824 [Chytriomyces hyalinus]